MNLYDKDGLAAVITWHGFCDGLASITHFDHDYTLEDYEALPNLYFVLVKDGGGMKGVPVAGFLVKSRPDHTAEEFPGLMRLCAGACLSEERVEAWDTHIRPQKLTVQGGPLVEADILATMTRLLMQHMPASSTV